MPPKLALLGAAIFVFVAFRSDRKRDVGDTNGLFWPTLWYLVVASHPIGVWFSIWGLPLPTGSADPTDGSIIDRLFFATLTVIGLVILARRRFEWGATFRRNPWLTAFVCFMLLSIFWSQYPWVSFKRFIKVVGSIVMAMVVLTSETPLQSLLTVLRRCLYIHLPMSILCTRYFREVGVSFDWSGQAEAWKGIASSKNVLGQVTMLGVIYFFWEVRRHWAEVKWKNLHFVYLLMGCYLLRGSSEAISMTSVSVSAFALLIFLRIRACRERPQKVRTFIRWVFGATAALIILVMTHSVVMFAPDSIFGTMITTFGRDITLTDRTFIWTDVYDAASRNPLLGVGFGGFWIGRLANIPWNENMTWVLGQAHSGYVETYLQIGAIGAGLLTMVLVTTIPRLLAQLEDDFEFTCFRITLFMTIVFVNITESVYLRGDHHLWFILMVIVWQVPYNAPAAAASIAPDRREASFA